ncbi:MAG: hypothetical protein JRI80_03630 [Deltaproteobacteria bacterium]|nr:hypothetical protein [Deltaproteobacteria bacterium]
MKEYADKHLTEDQIIRSVIDETELPRHLKEHLDRCSECREEKVRLERDLAALGDAASRLAPRPKRPVVLPETREKSLGWLAGHHSWALASAVCAVLVVFFLGWNFFIRLPQSRLAGVEAEIQKDGQFMAEINELVENPLPQVYRAISGEGYAEVDEDLMDFVIPEAGEEPGDSSPV